MIRQGVIYKFTNTVNGKVYIGQTICERNRINSHFNSAYNERSKDYESSFKRAIRKYGKESFKYDVLFRIKNTDDLDLIKRILDAMEIAFIDFYDSYNTGYNDTLGGSTKLGWKASDEIKKKISEIQKEVQSRPEVVARKKARMIGKNNPMYGIKLIGESNPNFGVKMTDETKKKISEARKGKKGHAHTEETKEKIRQKNKGKITSEETKEKLRAHFTGVKNPLIWKPVLQYTLNGEFIKEWECITSAEKELGITHIGCSCNGNRNQSGGFLWRFKESDKYPLKIKKYSSGGCRVIEQLDLSGNVLNEYDSIREASKSENVKYNGITEVLGGRQKTSGGYKWRYKQKEE